MSAPSDSGSGGALPKLGTAGVIVALIVAFFGLQTTGPKEKSAAADSRVTPKLATAMVLEPADAPANLILRYLRPKPAEPDTAAPGTAKPLLPAVVPKETYTREDAVRIEHAIIAAVPDPLQTQFGPWYDQLLEAYTEAICDAGYTPDRHWLPWELVRPGAAEKSTVLNYPGVIIFRNLKKNTVAVLFLVGETTNIGVNPAQLKYAFEQVAAINAYKMFEKSIRAVGPFFTGGQSSWLRAIRETDFKKNPPSRIRLVTGSANGLAKLDGDLALDILGPNFTPRVTQEATILPNDLLARTAQKYLKDTFDSAETRIAVLKEADTGFGRSRDTSGQILEIRYPMQVSRLSALAAEDQRRRDQKLGLAGGGPIANDSGIVERFVSFGGGSAGAVSERIIGDAMAVIRREGIRYVGLQSTDPRDAVYLTARLRAECPYVRVYLTDADLAFTVPENKYLMRGAIIASTYPLYPPNQRWTADGDSVHSRNFFPSQVVQGSYNALSSFVKRSQMREYRWPGFMEGAAKSTRPPVWITTIGETGRFVMLDVRDPNLDGDKPQIDLVKGEEAAGSSAGPPPPALLAPVRLAAIVAFALLGYVLWGQFRVLASYVDQTKYLTRVPGTSWGFFPAPDTNTARPDRAAVYLHLTLMSAVCGIAPLLVVVGTTLRLDRDGHLELPGVDRYCLLTIYYGLGTGWGLCAVGQLVNTAIAIWDVQFARRRPARAGFVVRILAHFAMLAGAAVSMMLCSATRETAAGRVLFLERAAGLLAGYSVVVPAAFLSLAFLVYALHALRRDWLGSIYQLDPPFPKLTELQVANAADPVVARTIQTIHKKSDELMDDLNDYAGFLARHWSSVVVATVGLLIGCLPMVFRLRSTGEGHLWNVLFGFGMFALVGLVAFALLRFLAGWQLLQQIMDRVVTLPMAGAFEQLPRSYARVFQASIFDLQERPYYLSVPLLLWQSVRTASGLPAAEPVANPNAKPIPAESIANDLNRKAAELVDDQLRHVWIDRQAADVFGSDPARVPKIDGAVRAAEIFVAVQAVLFISILFKQLRTLAVTCVWTVLLLILAATTYPFQPERLIMYVAVGMAASVVAVIGYVLVQVNRNEMVSRISGTSANAFTPDWSFLWNNVALLSPFVLVAAQASGRLRTVFEPLLEMIR